MKKYIVEITEEALSDMEAIYDHIAYVLLSPENAMGQYNRIADKILSLEYLPERNRVMDTELGHSKELRMLLVDNYSVFYLIKQDSVVVTDVLYSASDIESRLRQ
ncbi:MAG: type II toxin-antitoxin system RelE/ParE family toxin [Anaerovoracaceae bacterium]